MQLNQRIIFSIVCVFHCNLKLQNLYYTKYNATQCQLLQNEEVVYWGSYTATSQHSFCPVKLEITATWPLLSPFPDEISGC